MIVPRPEDAVHKAMMYRLLIRLTDNDLISSLIHFKGGTCASMLGYLDRFSVDLDFDLKNPQHKSALDIHITKAIKSTGMIVSEKSNTELFYIIKYSSHFSSRNTLKLSIIDQKVHANEYKVQFLPEIDRFFSCQSIETMFANKLVSLTDRYEKYGSIAGRDLYDIHHFFSKGYRYLPEIISERTNLSVKRYLDTLISFIENRVTDQVIQQDLNYLLAREKFQSIRKTLKQETLVYLHDELKRFPQALQRRAGAGMTTLSS